MDRIPSEALEHRVSGVGLVPGRLKDQLEEGALHLLVFLRHFGCVFCRETVSDLRAASGADPKFPPVIFFFQGSVTEGRAFLRRYWPEARAIADPDLDFYDLFAIPRASYLEALGPAALMASRRARRKGHANGPPSGDIWRMPGLFAVDGDDVVWSYRPRHAGDHPDFNLLPEMIATS